MITFFIIVIRILPETSYRNRFYFYEFFIYYEIDFKNDNWNINGFLIDLVPRIGFKIDFVKDKFLAFNNNLEMKNLIVQKNGKPYLLYYLSKLFLLINLHILFFKWVKSKTH